MHSTRRVRHHRAMQDESERLAAGGDKGAYKTVMVSAVLSHPVA